MKKKIFFQQFPLSRFLAKIAIKNFLKENLSFGADVKLWVPPLTFKIQAHNKSGVGRLALNTDQRIVIAN